MYDCDDEDCECGCHDDCDCDDDDCDCGCHDDEGNDNDIIDIIPTIIPGILDIVDSIGSIFD